MVHDQSSLWAAIGSYTLGSKPKNSILYKCLSCGKVVVDLGSKSVIHSGLQTSLWNDVWLPQGSLRNLIAGPLQIHENDMKVPVILLRTSLQLEALLEII